MKCRVCLQKSQNSLDIFDPNGVNGELNIANVLGQHLWFKPLRNDPVSTVICCQCWERISDFHQFYENVERIHLSLSGHIKAVQDGDDELPLRVPDLDIKEEVPDNVLHDFLNEVDEKIEAGENPLYEPEMVECLMKEVDQESGEENEDDDRDVDYKVEEDELATEELEEGKSDVRVTRKKRRRITSPTTKTKKSASAAKQLKKTKSATSTDDSLPKEKKEKRIAMTARDEELLKKHILMNCDVCAFAGEDYHKLMEHFRLQHKDIKPYIKCCNRKMTKRTIIVQHAYKHEDPEFFKCHECQKTFTNAYGLTAHRVAHHAKEQELKFQCDQCPKRFARRSFLDLHKPSHIPLSERAFVCEQCGDGRAFASEHLLRIHECMRHKRAANVCHVCAKVIRDKQAFEKHVRLHFEDSGPRVKCPIPDCDRWLKDEDNLKQHIRRHNMEGQVFSCNECGKHCKNRRSLTGHLNYAHAAATFSCDECNKSFKRAITLREHMAQHTGESLYKCPFCTRTFNSNANMHSHKKKMHPIEWDNWRKTKRGSAQRTIPETLSLSAESNSLSVGY